MSETYRVRIEKDYLVFSAGHFITFDQNICERLHGHNYRVSAEVYGQLDENYYVQRFTPRRAKSNWSRPNIERAEALIASGRMQPAGLRHVESAKDDGRWAG